MQVAMKAQDRSAIVLIMAARAAAKAAPARKDGMKCPMCCEEFAEGEDATRLPCCHYLHPKCMEEWLQTKDFCPICRSPVEAKEGKVG
jgi:hypothetical protein